MSNRLYICLASLAGIITGFVTIHSFFAHSWTSMILWVVIGLVVLYFSPNRYAALCAGAAFGFFDIALWLSTGFQGTTTQLPGFIALTLGLCVLGAACGTLGAALFYWIFRNA